MQVQDIVREYSCRFCKDLVRPLQLARVTVALYPSVGDVVSISAHLGAVPDARVFQVSVKGREGLQSCRHHACIRANSPVRM